MMGPIIVNDKCRTHQPIVLWEYRESLVAFADTIRLISDGRLETNSDTYKKIEYNAQM